jgi:NTE family protein
MKKKLAFVLGGGGARGALQIGALRALYEAELNPQIITGTSIGACNAAFLAINGFSMETLDKLEDTWRDASSQELLPSNFLWLSVRLLFNRRIPDASHRFKNFLIQNGLHPDLRFGDLKGIELYLVAADLNNGGIKVFGHQEDESIFDGVLASTALPPWVTPRIQGDQLLLDGGVVSELPIQAALDAGATEIIALELTDQRSNDIHDQGFGPFLGKLVNTVHMRHLELELALAEARNIPVCRIQLQSQLNVPIWDFSNTEELFLRGYEITQLELGKWLDQRKPQSWAIRIKKWITNEK